MSAYAVRRRLARLDSVTQVVEPTPQGRIQGGILGGFWRGTIKEEEDGDAEEMIPNVVRRLSLQDHTIVHVG